MALSKADSDKSQVGQFLWNKVGSRPSFKNSNKKNFSTVVSFPVKGGLGSFVAGVFTQIGQRSFWMDIGVMTNMPVYTFGKGIPNKIFMSHPLKIPMIVQEELAKKGSSGDAKGLSDEDFEKWSASSLSDSDCNPEELSEGEQEELLEAGSFEGAGNQTQDHFNATSVQGDPQPPPQLPIELLRPVGGDQGVPPNPALENKKPGIAAAMMQKECTQPSSAKVEVIGVPPGVPVPAYAVNLPTEASQQKPAPKKTTKPRAPRKSPARANAKPKGQKPTHKQLQAMDETITHVASGSLPAMDIISQAAKESGISPEFMDTCTKASISVDPNLQQ